MNLGIGFHCPTAFYQAHHLIQVRPLTLQAGWAKIGQVRFRLSLLSDY
jgi:hypothetical protein